MSIYLTGLALRCRVGNPYRKLLLVYLANVSDESGATRPTSVSYLEAGLECGRTSIRKYRDDLRDLGLLTWTAEVGAAGGTEYRINCDALRVLADSSWTLPKEPAETVRETNPPPRGPLNPPPDGPLNPPPDGLLNPPPRGPLQDEPSATRTVSIASDALTLRHADPILTNYLTNEQKGKSDFLSIPLDQRTDLVEFAPSFDNHPSVKMYVEAFGLETSRLRVYHREQIALTVPTTPASLDCWRETLESYRTVVGWNPSYLNNLFDRFKRYATNPNKPDVEGHSERISGPCEIPSNLSGGTKRGTRPSTASKGGTADFLRRNGYE